MLPSARLGATLREVPSNTTGMPLSGRCPPSMLPPSDGRLSSRLSGPMMQTRLSGGSPHADRKNRKEPTYCSEMIADITEMFLSREKQLVRGATYLAQQTEINEKMRMILVDWLVDVHIKFRHLPETFFLAIDIIDRYLAVSKSTRSTLQLVGITAMLLAGKYEEIYARDIKDCIHISANTYTRDDILKMERGICAALQFRLTVPTPFPFLARLLTVVDADETTRHAAFFFLEHAALDYKSLNFLPSQLANASLYLAHVTLGKSDPWSATAQHYSKSRLNDFRACAQQLLDFTNYIPTTKYQAIRRKYTTAKFAEVARLPLPTQLPEM
ncbi:CYC2-like cyclin, putative [Bodo saltans]|uniref:CYC2-like cyclin, putative n=1 Tax=Bodo saltans TaxID=75058 RepID=A0A0S4JDL7_BODSA|nr:CYC2-like cyclin, putative [Bodo saltans]|eukprot:CUG88243.1 CYC2-like cyclin, putative [Bodo saltans]